MDDKKRSLTSDEIQDILDVIIIPRAIPLLSETFESIEIRHRGELAKQLSIIKIYPSKILALKERIEKDFQKSLIEPGESVGMVAGQSIGERQTQTTLNSVDWTEKILIVENGYPKITYIGEWIDKLLASNKNKIQRILENRTEYMELADHTCILSVDEYGKISWENLTAVTRHLPVGKLLHVKTETGRMVKATRNKSFLIANENKTLTEIEGDKLKIGDKLPIMRYYPPIMKSFTYLSTIRYTKENKVILLSKEFGMLVAAFLLKGEVINDNIICIHVQSRKVVNGILKWCMEKAIEYKYSGMMDNEGKHPVNVKIHSKFLVQLFDSWLKNADIPAEAYIGPNIFAIGMLKTFFHIYGRYDKKEDSSYIELSNHRHFIGGFCTLLSKLGIVVSVYKNILAIFGNFKKLLSRTPKTNIYFDKIQSIENVDSTSLYVYDVTVPTTKNFCLLGGLGMRDTFHSAGLAVKTVVTGVPRFTELLSATKKQKGRMCTLYFNENKKIPEIRKIVGNRIACLTLKDIILKREIITKESPLAKIYFSLFDKREFPTTHGIRFYINISKLFEYSLKMRKIKKRIEKEYGDMVCAYSPEREGILELYIDVKDIEIKEEEIDFIDPEPENVKRVYLEEYALFYIEKIRICGIEGINGVFYREEKKEWIAETEGTNLKKLMSLDILDNVRIYSNDLWEIYYVLGVEAARQFLIEEYTRVLSADGTSLNPCHIKLVADIQTFRGIISFSRYGMRGNQFGPLVRSSFEVSVDNFVKAGMYSEEENMKGVSASIICGIPPKSGSGMCELKMDLEKTNLCESKTNLCESKTNLGGIITEVKEKNI